MTELASPVRLPASPAPSDLVAKYFRGFGDPLRVRILDLLRAEGELWVEMLNLAQALRADHASTSPPAVASTRRVPRRARVAERHRARAARSACAG